MKRLLAIVALVIPLQLSSIVFPLPPPSQIDVECLAENVYHEARGEPYLGQLAVATVTLNRARVDRFPKDVCALVYSKKQFSWTNKKRKKLHADDISREIATKALMGNHELSTFTATHYHNTKVKPKWAKKMIRISKIGNHIFYKETV